MAIRSIGSSGKRASLWPRRCQYHRSAPERSTRRSTYRSLMCTDGLEELFFGCNERCVVVAQSGPQTGKIIEPPIEHPAVVDCSSADLCGGRTITVKRVH